jgi:hypothetical protein
VERTFGKRYNGISRGILGGKITKKNGGPEAAVEAVKVYLA